MKTRILYLAGLALAASTAHATIYTWDQTAGNAQSWTTDTNWNPDVLGGPTPASGDTVDFSTVNITANTTLTLEADRTAEIWKFGDVTTVSQDWIVAAGNKIILEGTTPTINVVNRTATLNNVVDGTAGLTKTGGGALVLAGTNTFTGVVTINAGMLVASTTDSLPGYNSAGQVVFNGGTLQLPSAWAMADINTLVSNATKTAGALAIDTTNGNQTQTAGWNLGAVGLTKVGTGTLVLNQANTCPSLVVNDGKVVLDNATVTVSSSLQINGGSSVRAILGGTLNLAGATITRNSATTTLGLQDTITSGITGNPNVTKNTLYTGNNLIEGMQFAPAGGASQALGTINMPYAAGKSDKSGLTLGGDSTGNTVTSIIGSGDMYTTVRKRGPGTWTLGNTTAVTYQNYAGTTIAQGAINPSQYDDGVQVLGGTLVLDYTFSNASKLGQGTNNTLYLVGGTLQLDRSTGASGSHIEVVTATSLSGKYGTANAQVGWANITRASDSTANLRMNNITRVAGSGSTLNLGAAGIADCDNANTNGILGTGWATVAGADFAYNSTGGGDGTINALPDASYTDVQRLAPGTIADGSTTNVRLIEGSGPGGSITLGSDTTINTLNQSTSGGSSEAIINMAGQTLGTYAILAGSGSGALTIGSTVGDGTLRAAASGGELILHNYSSNPLTINSVIANNTSASSLILDGPGTTILAGANIYSGVTKLSGGVLEVAAGTWLSTSTHLQLNGGVFQSSGSFTRTNGYNTTAGQFNWTSEDGGGFAARGGKLTVKIGNNAANEQGWGWVVNAITPLVDQADNRILGPLKFGSTTADSEVEFQNNIDLRGETRVVDVTDNTGSSGDFATLSGVIRNSSTVVPAGLYKAGAGTLVLSGANTYNGATSVNAGKLVVGVAGVGSITSNVTVASSAVLGGSGTITGNVTLNAESGSGLKDGGKLAPGNSPGVLTVTGTTTLNTGSIFSWAIDTDAVTLGRGTEYAGLNTDSVSGTNAAVFQIVTGDSEGFADNFWTTSHDWIDIFKNDTGSASLSSDWSTIFSSFAYSNGTSTLATPTNGSFSWTGGGNTLTWTAVPEPTSALAGLLLGAGLLRRKRRDSGL